MTLAEEQISFYNQNGYLVVDTLFAKSEVEMLNKEALKFNYFNELPNIILEKNGDIRSIFAPHKTSGIHDKLYKQDRLVNPAEQLIGSSVYLHQFKLNNKRAFIGDWWEWHQDFPYWHLDDGINAPKMISVMILLQDTTAIHGPLIFIPKSHNFGVIDFEPKKCFTDDVHADLNHSLSADLKYTIRKDIFAELLSKYGFFQASGSAGTCIFFHPNIFHASNVNISPYERNTAIITYNDINNLPPDRENNRPDYLCSRDFALIEKINTL